MRYDIVKRVVNCAEHIVSTGATVRATAALFGVSKSTVHKDVTHRLQEIDSELFEKVREVLNKNKEERHLRGGAATCEKYRKLKA